MFLLYVLRKMSNYSTEKQTIQARAFLEDNRSSAEMLITNNWIGFRLIDQILSYRKKGIMFDEL